MPNSNLICLWSLTRASWFLGDTCSLAFVRWASVWGAVFSWRLAPLSSHHDWVAAENFCQCQFESLFINCVLSRVLPPSGLPETSVMSGFSKEWYSPGDPFLPCTVNFSVLYSGGTWVKLRSPIHTLCRRYTGETVPGLGTHCSIYTIC